MNSDSVQFRNGSDAANRFALYSYKKYMSQYLYQKRGKSRESYVSEKFLNKHHNLNRSNAIKLYRQEAEIYGTSTEDENFLTRSIDEWYEMKKSENAVLIKKMEAQKSAREARKLQRIEFEKSKWKKEEKRSAKEKFDVVNDELMFVESQRRNESIQREKLIDDNEKEGNRNEYAKIQKDAEKGIEGKILE